MNKLVFLFSAALILSLGACKKDDTSVNTSTNTSTIVQKGTWKVTFFTHNSSDITSVFSGYSFTFSSGAITATKANSSVSGTYSNKMDDSENKMVINFGNNSPLDELNEDWKVLQQTDTKLQLEHVSGGNGGTDLLTFEKN